MRNDNEIHRTRFSEAAMMSCSLAASRLKGLLTARKWEIALAAALWMLGYAVALLYVSSWGGAASFFQHWSMPAVTLACGRGFHDVPYADTPKVAAFLKGEVPSCQCDDLPESLTDDDPILFKNYWQRHHKYLLLAEALCFRLWGIQWTSLLPLYGVLAGFSVSLSFLFFRQWTSAFWACLLAVAFAFNPYHLAILPHLRDYSKAPFFLLFWTFTFFVVRKQPSLPKTIVTFSLLGMTAGLALGFRADITIALPFCLLLLAFVPRKRYAFYVEKPILLLAFLCSFVACSFPILKNQGQIRGTTFSSVLAAPSMIALALSNPHPTSSCIYITTISK
jgi:hypothetical protein